MPGRGFREAHLCRAALPTGAPRVKLALDDWEVLCGVALQCRLADVEPVRERSRTLAHELTHLVVRDAVVKLLQKAVAERERRHGIRFVTKREPRVCSERRSLRLLTDLLEQSCQHVGRKDQTRRVLVAHGERR